MTRFMHHAALAVLAALPLLAAAAPFAYVANEKSGTLSIVDTATDTVVGDIPAGVKPRGSALSPDGKLMYVSDQPSNALLVVDLEKRTLVYKIALDESPEGVTASHTWESIAVANEIGNSVSFISTATNQQAFRISTEGKNPEHAVFSPDGK